MNDESKYGGIPSYLKKFKKQTFDKYYTEYEQYLYTNKPVKYQIVAPLENFDCTLDLPAIKLSSNVRIVSGNSTFYPDIISADINRWMVEVRQEIEHYEPPEFFLEIDYEMEKEKVPSECKKDIEQVSSEEVQKVFKILRLYKEGDFRCGLTYWCSKTPCDPPYNDDYILHYYGNYSRPNTYFLQEGDSERIQLLFQKYSSKNTPKNKVFPTNAIDCFNKGLKDAVPANRLREFISALESLLVDNEPELSYRLAIRTAFFLEEDRKKCREIFDDIRKAYYLRNKIVHGEINKTNEFELNVYSNKTERYVRQAIIKWIDIIDVIEKKNKAQEIYNSIEDNLFS